MIKTVSNQTRNSQASNLEDKNNQKHLTLIERTFNNNVKSDYTEKIEELGKNFNYQVNRDFYWSDPELS
ncbi:hypothetical protein, partial [Moorena sp. SIO3I6]